MQNQCQSFNSVAVNKLEIKEIYFDMIACQLNYGDSRLVSICGG